MRKKIFLVCGRSCVGKSSIVKKVCSDLGLRQVRSYTTRPMRQGEEEESDHIFITDDDIKLYADDIAAYTKINGYHYFTTRKVLRDSDFYVVDPNGIEFLKEGCWDEFKFVVIYVRASRLITELRAQCRGDADVFIKRCVSEQSQFDLFESIEDWDYCIWNTGTFYSAVEEMKNIVLGEGVVSY